MNLLVVLGALAFLMFVAYRGNSVILFAPVAAVGAVLLTEPSAVPPMFSSLFMEQAHGKGYGTDLLNELGEAEKLPSPWIAILLLVA